MLSCYTARAASTSPSRAPCPLQKATEGHQPTPPKARFLLFRDRIAVASINGRNGARAVVAVEGNDARQWVESGCRGFYEHQAQNPRLLGSSGLAFLRPNIAPAPLIVPGGRLILSSRAPPRAFEPFPGREPRRSRRAGLLPVASQDLDLHHTLMPKAPRASTPTEVLAGLVTASPSTTKRTASAYCASKPEVSAT